MRVGLQGRGSGALYVAIQRDEFLRQKYIVDMLVYNPDMLIFLDETGTDRRNILRKYGTACVANLHRN